jgi:hypothetical protein
VSIEQVLVFVVAFAIVFLQLLGRYLKRQPWLESEQSDPGTAAREDSTHEEPSWEVASEAVVIQPPPEPPQRFVQPPAPVVPVLPARRPPPAATRVLGREPPREPVRRTLLERDHATLRRAMVWMAVLGPPRALQPPQGNDTGQ